MVNCLPPHLQVRQLWSVTSHDTGLTIDGKQITFVACSDSPSLSLCWSGNIELRCQLRQFIHLTSRFFFRASTALCDAFVQILFEVTKLDLATNNGYRQSMGPSEASAMVIPTQASNTRTTSSLSVITDLVVDKIVGQVLKELVVVVRSRYFDTC